MNDKFAVLVENVSKKFADNLKSSMAYGIRDITKDIFRIKNRSDRLRAHEFWAVNDVSFNLSRGEILGIIGANGSGKSTLLKLINGIFFPDKGRITINGRVGALIELGAGFHPMLTGRENIYVNAAILGISKKKVDDKFEQIVDFSGVGNFINMPVKYYSSGMHARLGFSVAAHMEADILLVDEVLAVGDSEFQEKSMNHMLELMRDNRAVIMVSHGLHRIETLCNRVIWIDKGSMVDIGDPKEIVSKYLRYQTEKTSVKEIETKSHKTKSHILEIERVALYKEDGSIVNDAFLFRENVIVRIYYHAHKCIETPLFNIRILSEGKGIIEADMLIDGTMVESIEGKGILECRFRNLNLTPRCYDILVWVSNADGNINLSKAKIYTRFKVIADQKQLSRFKGPMAVSHFQQLASPIYGQHEWSFFPAKTKNK